jgi:hypothetical protein
MVKSIYRGIALIGLLCSADSALGAWDDPPLINTVQSAMGNVALNFGSAGVHQQLALFIVNSNDSAGFHVDFTFANKGYFKVGTRQFAMSNVVVSEVSGTLGTGLTAPVNYPLTIDAGTGVATWTPPGTPTAATENYIVAIYVDWSDQSSKMAGFYLENITATIVSGP